MKSLWFCYHCPLCSPLPLTCKHNYSTGMPPELLLREPSVLTENLFQLLLTYSSSRDNLDLLTEEHEFLYPHWSCLRWATRLTNLYINLFWPCVLFHLMRGTMLRNLFSHHEKEFCKLSFFASTAVCSAEHIIIIHSSCSFPPAFPCILAKQQY